MYNISNLMNNIHSEERCVVKQIKKIVLAYSGGLDTSIIIPWLKENYEGCEVIAVAADVGQGKELSGLEEKAIKTGASKLYIEDLKDEFVNEYIFPTLQAGAKYEKPVSIGHVFCPSHHRQTPVRDRQGGGRRRYLPRMHRQG